MTIVRPPEAVVLPRVRPGHLEEIMNRVVRWRTVKPKTAAELRAEGEGAKPNKVVKCLPPVPVMRALQDRPKLDGVRRLRAVSSTPLVTPSGRIVEGEGYHPELQLLVDYGGRGFRPVPEFPTDDDVRAALAACMAPMDGYRFADGASRTPPSSASRAWKFPCGARRKANPLRGNGDPVAALASVPSRG